MLRAGTVPCSPPPTDGADFNGDGFADLAVGVPDEDVGAVADAGAVNVIYGSASGLAGAGNQQWTQNSTGIADVAENGDHFAAAVAVGDVNGDGRSDLIVGAPDENVGAVADAGEVHVLLGSPTGLTATGSQFWHQNLSGVADNVEAGDRFGAALAAADHTGDGRADVTIGAPTEDLGAIADAGAVHLLRGAAGGLTATGSQYWNQNSSGVLDSAESDERFGATLATGNLGGSARADLAIGAPAEDISGDDDAGAVHVLLSGASSLAAAGNQFWHQDSPGVADAAQPGDEFGGALAVGDVGGTFTDDLAIGADREDLGAATDAGVVHLLPGGASGPTATGSQLWSQDSTGIVDAAETGDRFGQALAIGNFRGDSPGRAGRRRAARGGRRGRRRGRGSRAARHRVVPARDREPVPESELARASSAPSGPGTCSVRAWRPVRSGARLRRPAWPSARPATAWARCSAPARSTSSTAARAAWSRRATRSGRRTRRAWWTTPRPTTTSARRSDRSDPAGASRRDANWRAWRDRLAYSRRRR